MARSGSLWLRQLKMNCRNYPGCCQSCRKMLSCPDFRCYLKMLYYPGFRCYLRMMYLPGFRCCLRMMYYPGFRCYPKLRCPGCRMCFRKMYPMRCFLRLHHPMRKFHSGKNPDPEQNHRLCFLKLPGSPGQLPAALTPPDDPVLPDTGLLQGSDCFHRFLPELNSVCLASITISSSACLRSSWVFKSSSWVFCS